MTRVFWILIATALVAGIFFRLEHVERRKVKADESVTALRVSGHTMADVRKMFDGKTHSLQQILRFQRVDPAEPVSATVTSLSKEEPHEAPLFYVLDRLWAQIAGSSIPSLRVPAMLFSLAAIAAVYWFCIELAGSRIVGGVAAALMSVSPFFVTYGGQARQYSLWVVTIVVASAMLLRALRFDTRGVWTGYGITTALTLYTDPLSFLVLAGHAAYVLIWYRGEVRRLASFAIAAGCAVVAFLPWIVVTLDRQHAVARDLAWADSRLALRAYLKQWFINATSVLFDLEWNDDRQFLIAIPVAAFIGYACYRVARDENRKTMSFLATLALPVTLGALLFDLVTSAHASVVVRYLTPLWIALLVAIAVFLGNGIAKSTYARAWLTTFGAVIAVAMVSSAVNSWARAWWDNHDIPSAFIARAIASSPSPVVIADLNPNPIVLEMSHYVPTSTVFLLVSNAPPFPLPPAGGDFLLIPSQSTLDAFRKQPRYALRRIPFPPGWNDYGLFAVQRFTAR